MNGFREKHAQLEITKWIESAGLEISGFEMKSPLHDVLKGLFNEEKL